MSGVGGKEKEGDVTKSGSWPWSSEGRRRRGWRGETQKTSLKERGEEAGSLRHICHINSRVMKFDAEKSFLLNSEFLSQLVSI